MPRVDAEHRGPLINIAAWILLVTMILFTASKVVTKWRMVRRLQNDDVLLALAMLTATGQCIATSEQAQHGLGQVQTSLSASDMDRFRKASYVDELFYIITIYLAKLAVLQFLIILARPNEPNWRRATVKGTLGLVCLWLVVAFICIAFQCKIPTPWNHTSGQCFNQARTVSAFPAARSHTKADWHQIAFWSANAAVDIVSTLMIGLMPIYLLYHVQLPPKSKCLAMLSFTPNLTTIPLSILRLIYLIRAIRNPEPSNPTFAAQLVTVIHTNYSIIASCLPFLKPFLDSLAIGLMTNNMRLPHTDTNPTHKPTKLNPFAILGGGSGSGGGTRSHNSYNNNIKSYSRRNSAWSRSLVHTAKGDPDLELELRALERYGSRERMVINRTRTTEVTSEPRSSDPEPLPPPLPLAPSTVVKSRSPSSVSISAGGPIPKPGYGR